MTPNHARYVGYARCSTDTQEPHRPTATIGRAGGEIACFAPGRGRSPTFLIGNTPHDQDARLSAWFYIGFYAKQRVTLTSVHW